MSGPGLGTLGLSFDPLLGAGWGLLPDTVGKPTGLFFGN